MSHAIRALYRFWAALLLVAVVVQVGLAGYGAFAGDHKANDHGTVTHTSSSTTASTRTSRWAT